MAKANSIAPFPAHLDREAFGHWLSGFTDGEGCFYLTQYHKQTRPAPSFGAGFTISLRADDLAIMKTIQSFFGCGRICEYRRDPAKQRSKPAFRFAIYRKDDLTQIVIPHFDSHPLLAKKAIDFSIWKDAVLLMDHVSCRRRRGKFLDWLPNELLQMNALYDSLKSQRQFQLAPSASDTAARLLLGDANVRESSELNA